jgi:hypothetical protein
MLIFFIFIILIFAIFISTGLSRDSLAALSTLGASSELALLSVYR